MLERLLDTLAWPSRMASPATEPGLVGTSGHRDWGEAMDDRGAGQSGRNGRCEGDLNTCEVSHHIAEPTSQNLRKSLHLM